MTTNKTSFNNNFIKMELVLKDEDTKSLGKRKKADPGNGRFQAGFLS